MDDVILPLKIGRVILEGIVDMKVCVLRPECRSRILGIRDVKSVDSCSLPEFGGKLTSPDARPPLKSDRTQPGIFCSYSPGTCTYVCNTKAWPVGWNIWASPPALVKTATETWWDGQQRNGAEAGNRQGKEEGTVEDHMRRLGGQLM
ncbi:MAG: hypothetical protein Q9184_004096 [Pyrenodesmia sp. 2 TL-2023]